MEKQMKKSLSRQMTAVFVGLLAFVLAAVFIVNAVFLGHYYTTHKESDLLNTYNALKEAQESDELTDENKQWKLSYELEKMNIDVCVMNVDRDAGTINEIFSNVKEKSLLYDQTLRIFFSKDTGNETVLKSTDQYVMRKMTDRQNGTDYLEMWGYLDDDFFVLMRSPLESIRESASLANQFLIYLGIIGMVVGGLLVWIFSRKITRPVMELARLSEDMANLNFDMKYTSGGNNEIGILCHLHEQGFHIFQIYIEGGCIHSRDDLCHEPSLWHIHFPQIVQSPHTVVLYNDLGRLILLLTLCQKHFIKFRLILQNHQRGVGLLKKFVFVLFDSFFAGNDQVAFAAGKIIIRQSLLHKPGLAALQKSVYDKYRDLCHYYLPHYSVRPNTFASSSSFRWEPITHRRPV